MNKQLVSIIAGIVLVLAAIGARADVIYESATLGTTGFTSNGWLIEGRQWLGSRFSVDVNTMVSSVGGHIATNNDLGLFAAIVPLVSEAGLPIGDPGDIMQTALAGSAFDIGNMHASQQVIIPLSVLLTPGSYGLVFGSGYFGATGNGIMPTPGASGAVNLPGASYFDADAFNGNVMQWKNSTNFQVQFLVQGYSIPEPSAYFLVLFGIVGLILCRRARPVVRPIAS